MSSPLRAPSTAATTASAQRSTGRSRNDAAQ
jgi:hypothetical protein